MNGGKIENLVDYASKALYFHRLQGKIVETSV